MGENSKIEWTDATFNPWVGCQKISPACQNCYAESWAKRAGHPELWQGERRRTSQANWHQPIRWNRQAAAAGVRKRVFCASLADVFDNQVLEEWRSDLWDLIALTPHLDWLLLTKRPQNIAEMLPDATAVKIAGEYWPWPNVWIGTTAENQDELATRAWYLSQVQAAVRFLSCEPLLGQINTQRVTNRWGSQWNALTGQMLHAIGGPAMTGAMHLVICGGESGPHARPMHPDWARSLRDQCTAAGVPFFFKQWGEFAPTSSVDGYWHGAEHNRRAFPDAPGIAWLADGRICLRDFSVREHRERMREKVAVDTRAVEVDEDALADHHRATNDEGRPFDNPLGFQWMYRVGKKRAGRLLDGREWNETPKCAP